MKRIGITGTIASGKTSLCILLKRHGFAVFNSDRYAGMCLHAGNPVFEKIVENFSEDILDETGDVDRKKMASIVFQDEEKRLLLNSLVHPYVREGMEKFFENQKGKFAFAEVPLLFEAGMEDAFDEICVVTCSYETAVKRMMEDRDYTREEADRRYNSQYDPEYQKSHADTVIENDGTLTELNEKVNEWLKKLRREKRGA